ncbi:DUF4239 domain-containing protein [uncultured Methylobacterium sp.]|jgi:hypothetical protein|uniref:bestrophin-like domain n=1 Tax=uncultured Methylobacterium sp. TaxID=157278 RepID=UPI00260B5070|nr:DUF4239 domain-containing protein [uncultured Methylobacterium sp.]
MLGFLLDQPAWLIFLLLTALFAAVCLGLHALAFSRPTRGFARSFDGVVPSYFGVVSVLLSLLVGFVASDAWERHRQAVRSVQMERDSLMTLYDLSIASKPDMSAIRADLATYVAAVIDEEWALMRYAGRSIAAGEAMDRLLRAAANPRLSTEAGLAVHNAMLDAVMRLRSARSDRLTLANNPVDESKWITLLVLAVLTLVSLALVHMERPRASLAAMALFAVGMVTTLGLVALHERPFGGPNRIEPHSLVRLRATMNAALSPGQCGVPGSPARTDPPADRS